MSTRSGVEIASIVVSAFAAVAGVVVGIGGVAVSYFAWSASVDALGRATEANKLSLRTVQFSNWPLLQTNVDKKSFSLSVINKGTGVARIYRQVSNTGLSPSAFNGTYNQSKAASNLVSMKETPLIFQANLAGYVNTSAPGDAISAGEKITLFEIDYPAFEQYSKDKSTYFLDLRSNMQVELDVVFSKINFDYCYTDISGSSSYEIEYGKNPEMRSCAQIFASIQKDAEEAEAGN